MAGKNYDVLAFAIDGKRPDREQRLLNQLGRTADHVFNGEKGDKVLVFINQP